MPDPITSTYFVPVTFALSFQLPPHTCFDLATKVAEACENSTPLAPFTDEAAKAIATFSQRLAGSEAAVARPQSWFPAASGVVTSKRAIGWSALIGGGYMLVTTFLEWRRVAGEGVGKEGNGSMDEEKRKRDKDEEREATGIMVAWMAGAAGMWVLGWIILDGD